MTYPTVSTNPDIQSRYEDLRDNGDSHNMAEMLATRSAPGTKNMDRAFLQGTHQNGGLDEKFGREYLRRARKAGIPTTGKVYLSQLADGRGAATPAAWVSGLDDVRDGVRAGGHGAESLGIQAVEAPPRKQIRMAEDLVQRQMNVELAKDPSKASKLGELREAVIDKHGSKPSESHNVMEADG